MSVQSFSFNVPKMKQKRRWGKPKPGESLKMLAAGSLAFAKAYTSVEKLEHELEAELQRDTDNDPDKGKGIHKWRRQGGKWLSTKYVLLFIVLINVVDCALVLGELILDLQHVKEILTASEESTTSFLDNLRDQYPDQFLGIKRNEIEKAYQKILTAKLIVFDWQNDNTTLAAMTALVSGKNGTSFLVSCNITDELARGVFEYDPDNTWNSSNIAINRYEVSYSSLHTGTADQHTGTVVDQPISAAGGHPELLGVMGYILHKTSLTICTILVVMVMLKIICFGRSLLHRRLEVFDTIVIVASFIVDLIFVKGLANYPIQEFVFILVFMLPWRVIRVTNSLVVAVKDHEHFRLKLLFTQKKKIEQDNKQIRIDRDNYKEQVDALKKLCLTEGVDDWKIFQSLAKQHIRPGKGAMGSFASLVFGGQKSQSFWSVLGTPHMRRGKSMEYVDNKISPETHQPKRHSRGRLLSFLGSSTDFFRGKFKTENNVSTESDRVVYIKNNYQHYNGHVGKRLERGETIDTCSTDTSLDGVIDHKSFRMDDSLDRQDTVDSSVFERGSLASQYSELKSAVTPSPNDECEYSLCNNNTRLLEESPIVRRPSSVPGYIAPKQLRRSHCFMDNSAMSKSTEEYSSDDSINQETEYP